MSSEDTTQSPTPQEQSELQVLQARFDALEAKFEALVKSHEALVQHVGQELRSLGQSSASFFQKIGHTVEGWFNHKTAAALPDAPVAPSASTMSPAELSASQATAGPVGDPIPTTPPSV